jgi:hypothetical protein
MSRKTNIVHITFHCLLTGVTRSAISANHRKKIKQLCTKTGLRRVLAIVRPKFLLRLITDRPLQNYRFDFIAARPFREHRIKPIYHRPIPHNWSQ